MKSFALYLFLIIIYLAVRSTLLAHVPSPDLSLIIVFYIASQKATFEGSIFSFILGFLEDVFTGGVIGTTSLCLVVVFLATHFLSRRVEIDTPVTKILGIVSVYLLKGALSYLVFYTMNQSIPPLIPFILTLLVTGILALPLFNLIARIDTFVIVSGRERRAI